MIYKGLDHFFRVQFILLVCPSVCGWCAEDIASLVPRFLKRVFQNWLVNFGSWSKTITWGRLWWTKMCLKNNCAIWGAVALVWVGIKCACLDNQLTTTKIELYPCLVLGSCTIKSIVTCSHWCLGVSSVLSNSIGCWFTALFHWQRLQLRTYFCISLVIFGQK